MKRIVVGLVVGGATLAAAIPASASPPTWHSTTLAAPAFPGFVGVGASSASDVWAVGENDADRETPYAQHWNGSSWASVPIPLPGPSSDILDGGLFGVARAARMTDFSVSGLWGSAMLSPDQQRRHREVLVAMSLARPQLCRASHLVLAA